MGSSNYRCHKALWRECQHRIPGLGAVQWICHEFGVRRIRSYGVGRQIRLRCFSSGCEFGRWNGEDYFENVWWTNAVGTKNILRMQERERFKAVYLSSSEVYGDYESVMSENVLGTVEIKQMNDYAMSKRAQSHLT